jgi:hypothetical protein
VYLLKEQALDIFEEGDEETALQRLERWFANVKEANFAPFDTHGSQERPSRPISTGS